MHADAASPRLTPGHLVHVALWGVLFASLTSCTDLSEPPWWQGPVDNVGQDTGFTARVEGQGCNECAALALGTPGACPDYQNPPADALRMHFIDVGQGDAIFIQTPTGENILIDAGDGGFFERTEAGPIVERYLEGLGLPAGSILDAIVITHAHTDHYGGLEYLTAPGRYQADKILDPGVNSTNVSYQDLISSFTSGANPPLVGGTANFFRPVLNLREGLDPEGMDNTLVDGKGGQTNLFGSAVTTFVLSAESSPRLGDAENTRVNNTSVVFQLEFANRRVLLMGDAEVDLEDELIQRFGRASEDPEVPTMRANIIKIGHHGSNTSSSPIFLDTVWRDIPVEDRYAVIQSGRLFFNGKQLPAEETVRQIQRRLGPERLFSTEAGDANKAEDQASNDDHVLAVVRPDSSMFMCYLQP